MTAYSHESISYLKKIMIISTFGGLLFGYDTGVINGALSYMGQPDQLNLTPLTEGMVVSVLLLGCCFGAVFGGKLSDMQGRKRNIIMLSVIFFIAAIGCSLAPTFEVMLCTRFVLGLAVGGASVTVPAYLAEVSPAEKRGRMVSQNELMIVSGQFLAFVFNAIIAVALAGNPHVWRFMLAVAAIPAIVLFFGMMKLPESPRWLVSKGRITEATAVLKKVRQTETIVFKELEDIKNTVAGEKNMPSVSLKDLNVPWVRRIILIGMGIGASQQLTGINSIMYYGTQVLNQSGFSLQTAIIANTLNGLTTVLSTLLGIWLLTKMRRRTMLLTGFTGTTISLFLVSISSFIFGHSSYFPFIILFLIVLFLVFMAGFIAPIAWLLVAEIIPLRFRGLGMGCCVLIVWVVNFLISTVFPVLLNSLGLNFTFLIFVIAGCFSITFVKLFVPETKGKTLEQIEHQFRNYNRKQIQSL